MNTTLPSLSDSSSEAFAMPALLHADAFPRIPLTPYLTIRPKYGEVGLSKELLQLMKIDRDARISIGPNGKGWFVTQLPERGFVMRVTSKFVKRTQQLEVSGGTIESRSLVKHLMEKLSLSGEESIRIPVTRNEIIIEGIDKAVYPYPFRRLLIPVPPTIQSS